MHDTETTIKLTYTWLQEYPANKTMVVLQATNLREFNKILDFAAAAQVATVALPKLLYKYFGAHGRVRLAGIIHDAYPNMKIHCLGCTGYPQEAIELQKQGIVRSLDSSAPVVLGLQGTPLDLSTYDWEKSRAVIPNYFNVPSTLDAEVNLDTFTQWCRGG